MILFADLTHLDILIEMNRLHHDIVDANNVLRSISDQILWLTILIVFIGSITTISLLKIKNAIEDQTKYLQDPALQEGELTSEAGGEGEECKSIE